MPEFSPSDDELISSYLDNEVTSEERALVATRLAAEPEFAARLEELQAASALAAAPVTPLSPGQTTDLIAAALAASTTTAPNVTDLAAASAARKPGRWKGALVSAVAAVAALAIAVPVLQNLGGEDADDMATSADAGDSAETEDGFAGDMATEATADDDAAAAYAAEAELSPVAGGDAADDDMADEMDGEAATDETRNGVDDSEDGDAFDDEPTIDELATEAEIFSALGRAPDATANYFSSSTDFDRSDDAIDLAIVQWENRRAEDAPASTTTTVLSGSDIDALEVAARSRLDALGGCDTIVDELRFQPFDAAVVAIELTSITVQGAPATLLIAELANGDGVFLVFFHDECVIEDQDTVFAP